MIAVSQPTRTSPTVWPLWLLSAFFLPVYLVVLFLVGAITSTIQGMILLKAKFRLTLFLGGGFSGLAAWFTVMLNHRSQYDWVVSFLCRFMTENWAKFATDSFLCWLGATTFMVVIVLTKRTTSTLIAKVRGKKSESEKTPDGEEVAEEDQAS